MQVAIDERNHVEAVAGSAKRMVLVAPVTAVVAATVNGDAVMGLGSFREVHVQLVLTDAKAAAGDTLSVYIDTSYDGGLTWINAARFATILGNGADAIASLILLSPSAAPGTVPIDMTGDAASGVVRPGLFGDELRARYVVVDGGAHGQSFTFSINALAKF